MNSPSPRNYSDHAAYVPGGTRLDQPDGALSLERPILRCCGYVAENRDWSHLQVFSPFWRLYYNFAPGHHVQFRSEAFALSPEAFLLLPENMLFHCQAREGAPGHLYIHFNLPPAAVTRLERPVMLPAEPAARRMAEELARDLGAGRGGSRKSAHLSAALSHWALSRLAEPHDMARSADPQVAAVLQYIEDHLAGDLSNAVLAKAGGLSVRSLLRAFTGQVGLSPQRHVRDCRLREAARRLAHSNASIDEIASDLGFGNRYYFTRMFSRFMSGPPGEFRKRRQ